MIDADVFDLMLKDAQSECKKSGGNFRYGVLSTVRANLANMSIIDAVPVVRCKDCKYWIRQTAEKGGESVLGINYTTCVCKNFRDWDTWNEYDSNFGRTDEDWFCADGERRQDDV